MAFFHPVRWIGHVTASRHSQLLAQSRALALKHIDFSRNIKLREKQTERSGSIAAKCN